MTEITLEDEHKKNLFYRDSYRKIMVALLFSILLVFAMTGMLVYMMYKPTEQEFFATSIDSRVTKLRLLDHPNLAQTAIMQWANQAAISVYSFDFLNYNEALAEASLFFTPNAWKKFMKQLKSTKEIEDVRKKKLIVSAVATGVPTVLQKGIFPSTGEYSWRIQMPMLITHQSASDVDKTAVIVTMLVTRMSTLRSPMGIGIDEFVMTTGSVI